MRSKVSSPRDISFFIRSDLASRLDAVLSKGDGASAQQVWDAVKAYFANPNNCNVSLTVKLTLTEKVLGVKGSVGDGETSGGGELSITRGKEITLFEGAYFK